MKDNNKLVKINHLIITCMILSQPFIVMFQATIVRDIQLFGFSIFEFFNIALVTISMFLSIYTFPKKHVFLKYIPYVLLCGAYFLLHGIHIYRFNQSIYSLQSPNFLVETYYIVRTFMVPILLLFDIYYSQMKKENLLKVLEVFVLIIASVMVLTNLFKVAQRNYSDDVIYNTLNLFDWFSFENTSKYSYYKLTTKGWFLSGNQMSAILFMSFPVIVYRAYIKRDLYRYTLVILQTLSMFMLGTRTANLGSLLVMMVFVGLWLIFLIFKQKHQSIVLILLIGIVFGALFPFSPLGYKLSYGRGQENSSSSSGTLLDSTKNYHNNGESSQFNYEQLMVDTEIFRNLDAQALNDQEKQFVKDYLMEYCSIFGISPFIIEHYNDLDHSSFWVNYLQTTPNNDYRVLKTMILEDIYANNDNPMDKYFGMGYTLNYIYTEADYAYQFYLYGIVGLITLIGPYIVMILYVIYQGIKHFKLMFNFETAIYFMAPLLGLVAAKFSGHVLERPFPLIVMAVLLSILLCHVEVLITEEKIKNGEMRA